MGWLADVLTAAELGWPGGGSEATGRLGAVETQSFAPPANLSPEGDLLHGDNAPCGTRVVLTGAVQSASRLVVLVSIFTQVRPFLVAGFTVDEPLERPAFKACLILP